MLGRMLVGEVGKRGLGWVRFQENDLLLLLLFIVIIILIKLFLLRIIIVIFKNMFIMMMFFDVVVFRGGPCHGCSSKETIEKVGGRSKKNGSKTWCCELQAILGHFSPFLRTLPGALTLTPVKSYVGA